MRLRYTGAQATTFMSVGEFQSGDVFTVPDEQAEGFLRRPDVEEAPDPEPEPGPAAKLRKPKSTAPTSENTEAAAAAAEEG